MYRNSRLINYNRWSNAAEVNRLVDTLVDGMKEELSIKKVLRYRLNMKTVLMELYHSYLTDKEQYIAYYRSKDNYGFKLNLDKGVTEHRYNKNPHIAHMCFVGCIDYLESKGYIENSPGRHFRTDEGGSYGYLSRMRATESLATLWEEYKFDPDMIITFRPDEVIILRGKEKTVKYTYKDSERKRSVKPLVDYLDDANTTRMRTVVQDYNRLLERSHIDVDVDCMTQADKDAILTRLLAARDKIKYTINLSAKQVYRVFNSGSFKAKEGGRFYGAWWIGCPSIIRKYITINGEPTSELDYSAIHINLLYALKKVNYATLNTDAYELIPNDPDRDLNKLILLTAYNAASPTATAKAVFKSTRDDGTKHHYNLTKHKQVTDKLELLKKKHPLVADMIAHDKGRMLQYHDSQVMERLIERMTALNIPILTVHDSIICMTKHKDFVDEKMKAIYLAYINKVFRSTHPYRPIYRYAGQVIRYIVNQYPHYSPQPIPTYNPILAKILPYKGRVQEEPTPTINVKNTTNVITCNQQCHHSTRLKRIKSGKRIFLGKIKIQYKVIDQVTYLDIQQR